MTFKLIIIKVNKLIIYNGLGLDDNIQLFTLLEYNPFFLLINV